MTLSIPNVFTAGIPVDPDDVNDNFTAIVQKINGNIGNAELNAGDPLALTKIAATYEIMHVTLGCQAPAAGGWAGANAIFDVVPVPGLSGTDANWTLVSVGWVITDAGAGTGTFLVRWGYYDAAGLWATVSTPVAATTFTRPVAEIGAQGYALNTNVLAFPAAVPVLSLALQVGTADATALSTAGSTLKVALKLRRQIVA